MTLLLSHNGFSPFLRIITILMGFMLDNYWQRTIALVVHVLHLGSEVGVDENISDEQIV